MSNKPLANPIAFTGQSPPWSLTQLDANFTTIQATINDTLTYSNYFVDQSGVANSIIISIPNTITVALTAGTVLFVKVANTVTGATTLTINALVAQAVVNPDGSAMSLNQLLSGAIAIFAYDGTRFQFVGVASSAPSPRTAAEIAAGVVPSNMLVPSHVVVGGCLLERYGGGLAATAAANNTAFSNALLVAGQQDLPIFISAGAGQWQFSAAWVMTGTGQALAGIGAPVGGAGVTGCRVLGYGGRPIIQFTGIAAGTDLITLGGTNLPQVEFRNLQINCNSTGRDGVVILGSSHPIMDNLIIENSTRDAFVLSPNGTPGQWIERGEFSLSLRTCGRHAVMMSLLGTLNPFINECVWSILEVRGVSTITAGGNAIAVTAVGGLGGAAKVGDHVFLRTVFDAIWVAGPLPDVSPVKVYSGTVQNWTFISPAWENTAAGGLIGAGGPNVSTNGGAGTITGLTMIAAITNSNWSNSGPDPLILEIWNFDYSYNKTALSGPTTITGPDNSTLFVIKGQTTGSTQPDSTLTRTGAASGLVGQNASHQFGNSTSNTFVMLQEFNGALQIWTFSGGLWGERARVLANGAIQIGGLSAIYTSTGGAPSGGTGVNGDFGFRQDGGAGTCIYQKRAGVWTATGA